MLVPDTVTASFLITCDVHLSNASLSYSPTCLDIVCLPSLLLQTSLLGAVVYLVANSSDEGKRSLSGDHAAPKLALSTNASVCLMVFSRDMIRTRSLSSSVSLTRILIRLESIVCVCV